MTSKIDPLHLAALLADGDVDAALAAGLMDYRPAPADATLDPAQPDLPEVLLVAQARLQAAWAARERHRARAERLQRRADERQAKRIAAPTLQQPAALPPAVASLLARAKAKAAGGAP